MSKTDPHAVEVIKDKLYFTTHVPSRPDTNITHYFTVEDELTYEPFFADFGPLNLGHVYSYSRFLDQKMKDENIGKKKIYHYSSMDNAKRTNAIFLIGAYCVLVQQWTAETVYRIFSGGAGIPSSTLSSNTSTQGGLMSQLALYRDPSVGPSTFGLSVLECWRALIKARECRFFDLLTFDPNEYYFYERVENGDMNWIVPGKFLAFSGPHASHHSEAGLRTLTPDDYIPYFKKHNVVMVVRLNKKVYDKKRFTDYGIKHSDMYFVDGSTPSESIVQKFLEVVESEGTTGGAIAVHCKAGLGRTGTLIACSLMKHYKFTAHEAIAWLRICRPGSVIGPQQHFLVQMQASMWKEGDLYKKRQHIEKSKPQKLPSDYNSIHTNGGSDISSKPTTITNTRQLASGGAASSSSFSSSSSSSPSSSSSSSISSSSLYMGADGPSTSPQNVNNSKERLKADMRLITQTLKSMRTTPPTTPTLTQATPKFSQYTSSQSNSEPSPYSAAAAPPSTPLVHSTSTTSTSYASSTGTTPSSPSSNVSASAFYLNSPYAQPKTYKAAPSSSSPTSSVPTAKKLPSGLSLQHRKIENQANRHGHTPTPVSTTGSKSAQASLSAKGSSITQKPGARSLYDRHTSPSSRSMYSTPYTSQDSSSSHGASVISAKQPYTRKSRSSANLLSPYTPPSSDKTSTGGSGVNGGSGGSGVNGVMGTGVTRATVAPTAGGAGGRGRSASNGSPAYSYAHAPSSSHSSSSPSSHISTPLTQPPPSALSREVPRRHLSAPRSSPNQYSNYLFDTYQKKSELRYT